MERDKRIERLYLIGAAAYLLADLLSSSENIKLIRSLKEVCPEIEALGKTAGTAAIYAQTIGDVCHSYTRKVEGKTSEKSPDIQEALEQFRQSALYLERWITVLYEVPYQRHAHFSKDVGDLVALYRTVAPKAGLLLEQEIDEAHRKALSENATISRSSFGAGYKAALRWVKQREE